MCPDASSPADAAPLRVLSISTLFPGADRPGFGLFVARQAQAAARAGLVELVVLNPLPAAPPPFHTVINRHPQTPAQSRDWEVETHHPRFATVPGFGWRWNPALIARAALPLARRLHAERPFDVVDAQFFYPDGPAAALIARALNLPLTIKARGSDIHLWGARPAARRQMLAAAQQAAGMLAVSEALKHDMAALGMPADRIAVHYTGLDPGLFHLRPRDETRARLTDVAGRPLPADQPLLLTVGNLIALKGQALVIEALTKIPGAVLAIAGKGPDEAALREQAHALGLTSRIHFLGGVAPQRLAEWMSAADVMVLPSEREGLANAWIETLACGTPLVITDVGGAREVVRSAAAGRLVDREPAAIAAAVRAVLADPPDPREAAATVADFSWETNARQLAAFWRTCAE